MNRTVKDWSQMWLWLLPSYALLTLVRPLRTNQIPTQTSALGANM
jgi:hypothetical protein